MTIPQDQGLGAACQVALSQLLPFQPGALDAFTIQPCSIGIGAFSRVMHATDAQGTAWALKLIYLPSQPGSNPVAAATSLTMLCEEVRTHARASGSPSILPLHTAFRTQAYDARSGRPPLDLGVLQLPLLRCNLMTLLSQGHETIWGGETSRRPHLSTPQIKAFFLQMVNALRHCHEAHITHQDIKLENFLLAPDQSVLLCDFGLAHALHTGSQASSNRNQPPASPTPSPSPAATPSSAPPPPLGPAVQPPRASPQGAPPPCQAGGTCWTMSPARLRGLDEGAAADWFSLGIVLYQLYTNGAWPFKSHWEDWERCDAATLRATIQHAVQQGCICWEGTCIPPEARRLIQGLLHSDAAARGGLPWVLASSWLRDDDFTHVWEAHPQLRADMQELLQRRQLLRATLSPPGQLPGRRGGAVTAGWGSERGAAEFDTGRDTSSHSTGSRRHQPPPQGSPKGSEHRSSHSSCDGRESWSQRLRRLCFVNNAGVSPYAPSTDPGHQPQQLAPLLPGAHEGAAATPAAVGRPAERPGMGVRHGQRHMSLMRRVLYFMLCGSCFGSPQAQYERL